MVIDATTILVVGCGSIGKYHARLLAERDDVQVWLCDILEEHLQAGKQIVPEARAFQDFDEALAASPDAVFVCTPDAFHRPMAVSALEAGCDVFCEKPVADTLESAEAIRDAAEAAPGMLQVGYVLRCHPGIRKLNDMIASGEIGNLVGARALVGAYYTLMRATTDQYLEAPNALVLGYTHQIDYLRLFLGEVVRVSAEADTLGVLDMMPEPNVFSMLLRYRSGVIGEIHLDFVQHPQRHTLELYGDRKTAVLNTEAWQLSIFDRDQEGYQEIPMPVARDELYRTQIAAFLNSVHGDRVPICSVDDGVAAVAVAEAAVRSSQEHCMIEL